MGKRDRKVVNLADYRDSKAREGGFDIEVGDVKIPVPPAALWPDEVLEYGTADPVRAARALLGDDYDAFSEAGGTAGLLLAMVEDELGADVGES